MPQHNFLLLKEHHFSIFELSRIKNTQSVNHKWATNTFMSTLTPSSVSLQSPQFLKMMERLPRKILLSPVLLVFALPVNLAYGRGPELIMGNKSTIWISFDIHHAPRSPSSSSTYGWVKIESRVFGTRKRYCSQKFFDFLINEFN